MKPIKILHLIPNLLTGGAERLTVDLVNELAKQFDVKLVLFYSLDRQPDQFFLNELNKNVSVEFLDKKRGFSFKVFFKLFKILRSYQPSIVHSHLYIFKYIGPLLFLFQKQIKAVHTIHSEADRESSNIIDRILKKFLFRYRYCCPVVVSKGNVKSFKKVYKDIAFKLIENGRKIQGPSGNFHNVSTYINSIVSRGKYKIFLFIGRLEDVKNPKLLISAFKLLKIWNPNVKLLIIGRSTDYLNEMSLKQLIEKLELEQSVIYLGEKNNVYDYMLLSDYICISSKNEGMPISIIEAMSAGLIPISTRVGGIPDMIGDMGYFATNNNSESFANALKLALSASAEELSVKKEKLIEEFQTRFDIKICAQNYTNLYLELLNTPFKIKYDA